MEIITTTIAEPILSEVKENLKELIKRHVRYFFCLESIVKDFNEEYEKLEFAHDRMQNKVNSATRNTEEIEKDVEKWLKDVSKVLKDVEELKKETEGNVTCFSGWCPNWVCGYQLSRKAEQKRSIMLKLRDQSGKFDKISCPATLPGIEFLAPTDFELFISSKSVSDQIIEALKDDKINMVGFYGIGGVGKTTLAKIMGNKINKEIFDEVVMVVISQTPNFQKIQNELAESLHLKLKKDSEVERAKQLYMRFKTGKKILVILDDVWEAFNLKEKIGIPSNEDPKGCKVLLTTRSEQVCSIMNCQPTIQLNTLNEEEGLTLLKKYAGIVDDNSTLNDVAINVAGECCGLPLALVVIGRALKGKHINHWKLMSRKLKASKLEDIPTNFSGERGIYGCLKLSYDNLKDEETKLCFLLCSLFPEDFEISVEDLVRYVIELGLFKDAQSIEDAKIELVSTLDDLKHSCLLLGANEGEFVKMHDVVRDVALGIASKGKHVFMSKTGMQTEWSNEEGWDQYTAISCLNNKIKELPVGLVCPKLNFLLLGGVHSMLKVSDECFKEMKALKVVTLCQVALSLKSLQFLTNLKTLELIRCNLRDLSSISKLNKLEILSFKDSSIDELSRELSELRKLRIFDLDDCYQLKTIPSNFLKSFSQLEELYIGNSFQDWEIEETGAERRNASLSELISLSRLAVLSLRINVQCLPKDLDSICWKLQRYHISVNTYTSTSRKNALSIRDIEAASLIAFKGLYQTLECLSLEEVIGCQNIIPTIDQGGLNKLDSLELFGCEDLKCIIDNRD